MGRPMRRLATTLLSLAAFLAAWKLLTVVTGMPDYILPAPEIVAERALRAIGSGLLWEHTAVTISEILLGLAVGATSAIAVGTALGKSVVIERVLSPYIVAAQSVPILALAPLLDIWFGGGLRVGVTLAVIGAIVAEWAGASSGLGVLINIADQGLFDTPLMFVALTTLAVIGIGLHGLVVMVERRVVLKS